MIRFFGATKISKEISQKHSHKNGLKSAQRKTVIRIFSRMSSFKNECLNFSQIEEK